MATIKISEGPRYQKTSSPSLKKARKLVEVMTLVMDNALSYSPQKVRAQNERKIALRDKA